MLEQYLHASERAEDLIFRLIALHFLNRDFRLSQLVLGQLQLSVTYSDLLNCDQELLLHVCDLLMCEFIQVEHLPVLNLPFNYYLNNYRH